MNTEIESASITVAFNAVSALEVFEDDFEYLYIRLKEDTPVGNDTANALNISTGNFKHFRDDAQVVLVECKGFTRRLPTS